MIDSNLDLCYSLSELVFPSIFATSPLPVSLQANSNLLVAQLKPYFGISNQNQSPVCFQSASSLLPVFFQSASSLKKYL